MSRLADAGPLGCYSDEARRAADTLNLHVAGGAGGRWVAIRLSDGGSDGVTYDTRAEAIRHQLHESQCAYMRVSSATPAETATFLAYNRQAYDAGYRLPDPDDEQPLPAHPHLSLPRMNP